MGNIVWSEGGWNALFNGSVAFGLAFVLFLFFWVAYKIGQFTRLRKPLEIIVKALDTMLCNFGLILTARFIKTRWIRWVLILSIFSALAIIGAFAPIIIALSVIGFALFGVLAIYRAWDQDEDRRVELQQNGKTGGPIQPLRAEMLFGLGMMLFFFTLGFVRVSQIEPILQGHSVLPAADAAFFVWGELIKSLPLVDWSEVFHVKNLSGIEASDRNGMFLTFSMRVLFDLLLLVGIFRMLAILRNMARGYDLTALEAGLKSDDETKIAKALAEITRLSLLGRRNAIGHLFEISRATRADNRLSDHKWREQASIGLRNAANQLTDNAVSFIDLDSRLLAIEAYKTAAKYLNETRAPEFWAATQNNLGIALGALGNLSGDASRLDEAVAAYRAALEVHTKDAMPANWAATQNNLGATLGALGNLSGDASRLDEAVAAYRAALEVRTKDAMPADWAATQNNLGATLGALGKLSGDASRLDEAIEALQLAKAWYEENGNHKQAEQLGKVIIELTAQK